MAKKWTKRLKNRVFALLLLYVFVMQISVVAAAEESAEPYIYEYKGNSTETSSHHFTFQWWYGDSARENIRNRYHEIRIFEINNFSNSEEKISAYCSDFIHSAKVGARYKRINLEDSTYYNDAAARHIREIMNCGYWHTWTEADLEEAENKANAWLASYDMSSFTSDADLPGDAEEAVEPISNLTREEAMTATQLAIWAFANTEGDNWWIKFYESNLPQGVDQPGDGVEYVSSEFSNNIKAFRKYLIHQNGREVKEESILFTDNFFVTTSATTIQQGKVNYDVELGFCLSAPVSEEDELQLTAVLGNERIRKTLGADGLMPDEDSRYNILFTDVTAEDIESGIELLLTGNQFVKGIYFYEAKPEEGNDQRSTSQNLVGWAEGMTPVSATAKIEVDIDSDLVENEQGDLLISKQVEGVPTEKHFEFCIVLDLDESPIAETAGSSYTELNDTEFPVKTTGLCQNGQHKESITFTENAEGSYEASVSLCDGEVLRIEELPVGVEFTVNELGGENLTDDEITYNPEQSTINGKIMGEGADAVKAEFVNHSYVEKEETSTDNENPNNDELEKEESGTGNKNTNDEDEKNEDAALSEKEGKTDTVQTGDRAELFLWIILSVFGLCAMVLVLRVRWEITEDK